MPVDLSIYGITGKSTHHTLYSEQVVHHNPSVAKLYQLARKSDQYEIASTGALMACSAPKCGRSPKDKRLVEEESSKANIWWNTPASPCDNKPISEEAFAMNKEIALNFLNSRDELFVIDAFCGWDPATRIKVRVICTRAYHALFMWTMLVRPTAEELASFGDPDWVIFNAGQMPAATFVAGVTAKTSVNMNIKTQEYVILGTEYAGEMKKGMFTVMNYLLPLKGILSMHCSANEGPDGDVALFFGLSGTGKTTLSADPKRALIGDDEHGWDDNGVFNFEGGCYAKTVNLSREGEPQIWDAIKFGSILENVGWDPETLVVDYTDVSKTENTRCAYPVEYISNAKIPCVGGHPKNIVFLTCDAYGVLPPVSRLTPEQAMYHFISGYTAKVAGTEVGVTEPSATFSACFGAAFLAWHPMKYAELLAEKMKKHDVNVWLINTGWTGGPYGVGKRFSLKYTRAIVDAALDGSLDNVPFEHVPVINLSVPTTCPNVPSEVLVPRNTWTDKAAYDATAKKLAGMFAKNFTKYADKATAEVIAAGPQAD